MLSRFTRRGLLSSISVIGLLGRKNSIGNWQIGDKYLLKFGNFKGLDEPDTKVYLVCLIGLIWSAHFFWRSVGSGEFTLFFRDVESGKDFYFLESEIAGLEKFIKY